jgi:hypothetical protein
LKLTNSYTIDIKGELRKAGETFFKEFSRVWIDALSNYPWIFIIEFSNKEYSLALYLLTFESILIAI